MLTQTLLDSLLGPPVTTMQVRLVKTVRVTVWNYFEEDTSEEVTLRAGSVFGVGEYSPLEGRTVFELIGLGVAELPDLTWVWDEKTIFQFWPDQQNLN